MTPIVVLNNENTGIGDRILNRLMPIAISSANLANGICLV